MTVRGLDLVADNLIRVGNGFSKTVNETMEIVKDVLDKKVTENISIKDHSLKDLRDLDHPYSARHGSRGLGIHDPYYQVHEQSGKMLSAKISGVNNADIFNGRLTATAYVGIDVNLAPHALNVHFGTSKMIPRPFLEGSRDEVIPDVKKIINKNLKDLKFGFRK